MWKGGKWMERIREPGVLPQSVRYFTIPSNLAHSLLYYVTRCGHYYCNTEYYFNGASEIGRVSGRQTFLFFYIRSGRMALRLNQRDYTASAGNVVLIDCHDPHEYHATSDLEFIWIHFDGANSADFFHEIRKNNGSVFSVTGQDSLYQMSCKIVESCARFNVSDEIERSKNLHDMLCRILLPRPEKQRAITQVDQAVSYIHLHLHEQITVDGLAQHVGLSASHFSRIFRHAVGIPPYEYIILQRLERAKTLLSSTSETVREIAYLSGYGNEAAFTAVFTERVGISPRYYRKLVKYSEKAPAFL